jgi:stalled ribosome alternative rescue factor ArfA
MSKTNFERNRILKARYGGGSYTPPATVYCGLFTAGPTVSTGGTEVSGGSYARVAKTNNATNFPDPVAGLTANGTAVTFPTASGAQGTATHFGWFDASTGGNLLDFAPLTTPKVIGIGDTPEFGVGQLTWLET